MSYYLHLIAVIKIIKLTRQNEDVMNSRNEDNKKTNPPCARNAQSSLSGAKRWGSIPPDWVLKIFESHRVNPEWIKNNQEPMLLREGSHEPVQKNKPSSSEDSTDTT
jgi:hypothetical protein